METGAAKKTETHDTKIDGCVPFLPLLSVLFKLLAQAVDRECIEASCLLQASLIDKGLLERVSERGSMLRRFRELHSQMTPPSRVPFILASFWT